MSFLIFLAALFVSCGAESVWTEFPENERLYAAVSGDSLLPPEEFSAVLEGASPRLTWSARKDAVGYRIYRAVSGVMNGSRFKQSRYRKRNGLMEKFRF